MSHRERDAGFTLVELLVAMSLTGLMMALAVGGYSSWAATSGHVGTAREVQTVLRQAQQRAVTEGRATCVWFDAAAGSYTVYRGACQATAKQQIDGPHDTASATVRLDGPAFTDSAGTSAGVTFFARGTASPGAVDITRTGSTKVYRVRVEGLTGRVELA